MASKPLPAKYGKKKTHTAGSVLDSASWVFRELALPIPDSLMMRRKKRPKK
ncbi:MAG: hypothetical protein PHZ00_04860 [Candidatus Peribacteraceae bacterium]|nr:hypothetical protein [Candidatus Peribacteraceae bacterium]